MSSKKVLTQKQTHLYLDPDDINKLLIFQIPEGTPVELLGEKKQEYQKIVLTVWVPPATINSNRIGQTGIEVKVGNSPSDPLNSNPAIERSLQPEAESYPIQVLDSSNPEFVRIKIEGWMPESVIAQ